MLFELGDPRGKPDRPLPDYVTRNALGAIETATPELPFPTSANVTYPIELIGKYTAGIGHLNARVEVDGAVRSEPLVLAHFDKLYPALSMLIAAKSLNLGVGDIKVNLGQGVTVGNLRITTDPRLQMYTYFYKDRPERARVRGRFLLRPVLGEAAGGEVPRQDRAHRSDRRGPRVRAGDAGVAGDGAGADARTRRLVDPPGALLRRAELGGVGRIRRLPRRRPVPDRGAPPAQGGHGRGGHRSAARRADRHPLRAHDGQGHLAAADAPGGAARARPRAAHHQALPGHRARQGALGRRLGGVEPDARPRLPGPGPARHGARLLPQVPGRRRGARQPLQPRPRLRAQAPVQQGRERLQVHGRAQPEVPRPRAAALAREAALRDDDLRLRRAQGPHPDPHRRPGREADARPLPGGEGARQGRDGGRVPGQGPEDRARGRDQDDGARPGVRGRGARRREGALLPRGGDRRPAQPPEHRHHLRRRRGARPRATSRWSS